MFLKSIFLISAKIYAQLPPFFYVSLPVDRQPGDIEGITDIFFEDFKNFPQVRELGEDSARFVREEMEKTWGDSRMAVLSEDEAQKWILGVIFYTNSWFIVPLFLPYPLYLQLS